MANTTSLAATPKSPICFLPNSVKSSKPSTDLMRAKSPPAMTLNARFSKSSAVGEQASPRARCCCQKSRQMETSWMLRRPVEPHPAKNIFPPFLDRKSTRLNSSHTSIYPLSPHDALPISPRALLLPKIAPDGNQLDAQAPGGAAPRKEYLPAFLRSEEHTSELQSRQYLPSFPTRRSSDLPARVAAAKNRARWKPVGCSGARWSRTPKRISSRLS